MFTGIVTAVGAIVARSEAADRLGLVIEAPYHDLVVGESVAVNGACLTVVEAADGRFRVDVVGTTQARTTLAGLEHGARVNLERALAAGDRFGGHIVQGHVDGIGEVVSVEDGRDGPARVRIRVPPGVARTTIPLGSIAVDGVSLTVNAMPDPDIVEVSLIPHTMAGTTLGALKPGDRVQIEADVIGKYVKKLTES